MKTLICFGSKNGSTEKCANLIAKEFPGADVLDLSKTSPDLSSYESVIIGGSIQIGTLHKAARKFMEANRAVLLQKKLGLFFCSGMDDADGKLLPSLFPEDLLSHALASGWLGGELSIGNLKGLDKLIVKVVAKSFEKENRPSPSLKSERIKAFAEKIKGSK